MPLPNLPVPAFPNVPQLPGVPPLVRDANSAIANVVVGLVSARALVARVLGITPGPQWGIFDQNGKPVITGLSCLSFDYAKDSRVSDFPIENGGFASYNKVDVPADCKITFSVGGSGTFDALASVGISQGSSTGRATFLKSIDADLKSLYLFTVVTPDISYPDMNIVHYDYRRTAQNGVDLMAVDIWLREIREAPAPEFTATATPSGADPASNGTVQATPVPAATALQRVGALVGP